MKLTDRLKNIWKMGEENKTERPRLIIDEYDAVNTAEGFEKLQKQQPSRTVFIPRVTVTPAEEIANQKIHED